MMHKVVCALALLLWLGLLAPASAQGQKKAGAKPKEEPASKDDYTSLKQLKEIEGTLTYVEPSNRLMTLKVSYQVMEPNPAYKPGKNPNSQYQNWTRHMQQLMNQQQHAMNIRNPVQRMQRLNQLAAQMQMQQMKIP